MEEEEEEEKGEEELKEDGKRGRKMEKRRESKEEGHKSELSNNKRIAFIYCFKTSRSVLSGLKSFYT